LLCFLEFVSEKLWQKRICLMGATLMEYHVHTFVFRILITLLKVKRVYKWRRLKDDTLTRGCPLN
jgi:hypothetical protein